MTTENNNEGNRLDRVLGRSITVNWELVAWIVIIVLAVITRLWALGDRAMSHDESLHTFYSWKLFAGQGYQHDPMMHGPLLFHGTALSYFLFGVSDFTARLLAVVAGVLLVASPILLRKWLSPSGAIATGLMLLISPTVMYYSRYIRHDIPVELFTVVMFLSFIRYLNSRQGKWIVLAFAAGGATVTSAEMGYINGFVLVSFVAIALLGERLGTRRAQWLEIFMLALGLGLLVFASLANLGHLPNVDASVEGSAARTAMQIGFLASGLLMIFGLVSPLLTRFFSVPTLGTQEADWQLIETMPSSLAERGRDGSSSSMRTMAGGALTLAVGLVLVLLPVILGQTDAASSAAGLTGAARTLGVVLVFLGWFLVLYGVMARLVSGSVKRANAIALLIGLASTAVLGAVWYMAGGVPYLRYGSVQQGAALQMPHEYLAPLSALLAASLVIVLIAILGWILDVYRERGTTAAIAAASVDAIGVGIVVFAVIYTLLFTTFFTEPDRIDGFIRSLRYWLDQQEVVRGGQPWYYYSLFTPMYEFLPFFLSLAAIVVYAARRKLRVGLGNDTGDPDAPSAAAWLFVPMVMVWGLGDFWIFSWAGEKMPWLIVHLTVPMTFLAGRLCGDLFERVNWAEMRARGWMLIGLTVLALISVGVLLGLEPFGGQSQEALRDTAGFMLGIVVLVVLLWGGYLVAKRMSRKQSWFAVALALIGMLFVVNLRYSLLANFVNDELAIEYIVYAHGTPDDKEVYDMLQEMQLRLGIDKPLSIGYDNEVSWPFTWYFREDQWHDAQYLGERPSGSVNQDVLLVGSPNYGAFEPYLRDRYESIEYRRMWWPNEGYKNLTPQRIVEVLSNPNERRNLKNILLYRRYAEDPAADVPTPRSLTDWYHQANMKLYVRKDLVDKVWPLLEARPDWLEEVKPVEAPSVSAQLSVGATFTSGPDGTPMIEPKGIELGPDGRLYVVDHGKWRVLEFDTQEVGDAVAAVAEGDLFYHDADGNPAPSAWGVGVGDDGAVYVADTWNHRVLKFVDGDLVASVGTFGNPTDGNATIMLDSFFGPRDVAIGPDGNVYVTDTGNKRIVVLSPDLEPIRGFGGDGIGLGQFNEPTSLAFDPDTGELYVADLWNFRIQRFDAELQAVSDWTVDGWDSQEAAHKAYIAVGKGGVVVASDPSGMRVWVFDNTGNALATLDLPEDERGLDLPIGVAIDGQGRIYVASSNSGVVTRYQPIDVVLEAMGIEESVVGAAEEGDEAAGPGEGEEGVGEATPGEEAGEATPGEEEEAGQATPGEEEDVGEATPGDEEDVGEATPGEEEQAAEPTSADEKSVAEPTAVDDEGGLAPAPTETP